MEVAVDVSSAEFRKLMEAPFTVFDVNWKVQTKYESDGLAVPYLTGRAIQRRLDDVVGPANWTNDFREWKNSSQLCSIRIFDHKKNEWITKWDGAEDSKQQPVKGGLSNAFKRAATHWGIGRYLYFLENRWVKLNDKGFILPKELDTLKKAYNDSVPRLYDANNELITSLPSYDELDAPENAAEPAKPREEPPKASAALQFDYIIKEVKPNGNNYLNLRLADASGNSVPVVSKRAADLVFGAMLTNVVLGSLQQNGYTYNTLQEYRAVKAAA